MSKGIYQTKVNGIRGVVARAYKLHIELLTGEIYESMRDTIPPPGSWTAFIINLKS